jgi:ferric iron reductase protein FhuF
VEDSRKRPFTPFASLYSLYYFYMVTRLFIYLLLLGGAAVAGGDRLQELSQQARQAQACARLCGCRGGISRDAADGSR